MLNDDRADWRDAWALFPGQVAYLWHGALHAATVAESLIACGFEIRAQLIWAKERLVLSRGRTNPREPRPEVVALDPPEYLGTTALGGVAAQNREALNYSGAPGIHPGPL